MRQRISRLTAWILMVTMMLTMLPTSLAEENVGSESTTEIVYQTVDLSSDGTTRLTQEEYAQYSSIANDLLINSDEDSLTISNETSTKVYSLAEETEAGIILQELVYSSNEENFALSEFSQIELPNIDPNTVDFVSDGDALSAEGEEEESFIDHTDEEAVEEDTLLETNISGDAVEAYADSIEDVAVDVDNTAETNYPADNVETEEDALLENDISEKNDDAEADAGSTENDAVEADKVIEGIPEQTDDLGDAIIIESNNNIDSIDGDILLEDEGEIVLAVAEDGNPVEAIDSNDDAIGIVTLNAAMAEADEESVEENTSADDNQTDITSVEEVPSSDPAEQNIETDSVSVIDNPADEIQPQTEADASISTNEYEDEYKTVTQTIITAERLLAMIQSGDEFAIEFANKLGFGRTASEIESNLQVIVDEYHSEIDKGNDFQEPRFVINGVDIVLNKTIEEISLVKNDDGTYSASLNGSETGYRTSVMIDADASVTIIYDEKGEAKIERKVASGKPTDFVITLDVSGSMSWDGRDTAMLSALKVVLDEILQVKENTVSIVFWANNGAAMQIQVDNNGISQVFSGADGLTATKVFDASLVDSYGNVSSYSLSDATISQIESLYKTGASTEPDQGLSKALDLLKNISTDDGRNIGVMLFTDGEADWYTNERSTIAYEKEIAEQYGATIVNVSIGDEYDVRNYERYLDPTSSSYYEKDDQVLKDHVLYYNIPKLSNQELADRVSEMFEIAFEDITTETKALQTETITDGILAAYGAQLIETIPAGFELVELKGEDNSISYVVNGKDADGNTSITFNLGDIISGKDQVVSYCVIPTNADNDIGITSYSDGSDTVLHAQPVDRIDVPEENKTVTITVTKVNAEEPERPELPETHQHVFSVRTSIGFRYSEYDDQYHYISSEEIQLSCIICGALGDVITRNISRNQHGLLEEHQIRDGRCIRCGYVGEESGIDADQKHYYERLINDINGNQNPMDDDVIVSTLRAHYKEGGLTDAEITKVIDTLRKAPKKYRDLYLLSLFNYDLQINGKNGTYYSWPWNDNAVEMKPSSASNFINTFFHESGHAAELNIWWIDGNVIHSIIPSITELEERIQDALFSDVETTIRNTVRSIYGSNVSKADEDAIVEALINGNEQETGWFGIRKSDASVRDNKNLSEMYNKVRDAIEDSMNSIPYNNGSMVSDVYGGVTNNKIYGGNGHHDSDGYWWNDNGEPTYYQLFEAWAEFFSAKIQDDTYNINKNREYFPESTVLLEELAEKLYDYYVSYYSDVFEPYKHDLDGLRIS